MRCLCEEPVDCGAADAEHMIFFFETHWGPRHDASPKRNHDSLFCGYAVAQTPIATHPGSPISPVRSSLHRKTLSE